MRFGRSRVFFSPDGATGSGGSGTGGASQNQQTQQPPVQVPNQPAQQAPAFDYEKLANIIAGKQTVTEDTVLKSYFKQQGLSQEEAQQAMAAFKAEKAKNTPDAAALQNQLQQANALAQKAQVDNAATLVAVSLGLDAKTVPYVLKMADLSNVIGQDGKINDEAVKNAVNKVLEDVPQLKPAATGNPGFQIGGGSGQQQNNTTEEALKAAFGIS